jgi:hypothetical protein
MIQLEPCPHCLRHVKITEPACPFCAGALVEAFANVKPRAMPQTRLGRAAVFAFGVAATTSVAACGDNATVAPHVDAATAADAHHVDAAVDAAVDAEPDAPVIAIYSAAPTPDAPSRG